MLFGSRLIGHRYLIAALLRVVSLMWEVTRTIYCRLVHEP